jgi:hypothetical protein
MPLTLTRTIDASSEPISLAQAKEHLRVDDTSSDTHINSLIKVARTVAETWTRRQFISATYALRLDYFPGQAWSTNRMSAPLSQVEGSNGNPFGWCIYRNLIRLPAPPLISVSSIAYIDTTGTTQTLSSSNYIVDPYSEPARISPAYGMTWPATQARINAVTITYLAGWANATACPENVAHLIRVMVADYFENRVAVGQKEMSDYTPAVRSLADSLSWGFYL